MSKHSHARIASTAANKMEDVDFPIVCETCLGPNPAIRMLKLNKGKECKICERVFVAFRWCPGPNARYKSTEICKSCAKAKNVCQTCIFDLKYNLPVGVRDSYLKDHEKIELPQSTVGKNYVLTQLENALQDPEKAEQVLSPYELPNPTLERLARTSPYYDRNRAKLCTFYARGSCLRGSTCPYRHEMPPQNNELAKQNIKDRYSGTNDPLAKKMLKRGTNATNFSIQPPVDKSITALFLGDLPIEATEHDIYNALVPFGAITTIKIIPDKNCAIVNFTHRTSAEEAISRLFNSLEIHNRPIKMAWGKKKEDGSQDGTTGNSLLPPPPTLGASNELQYTSMTSDYIPTSKSTRPSRPPGM